MSGNSTQAAGTNAATVATARVSAGSPENFGAFSGAQITAHIDNVSIGTITSVNYTVHTEKVAQYTFGSPNPRRFVTGKRGIAGSMTFNMFDRSALLSVFAGNNGLGKPLISYGGSNTAGNFVTETSNANVGGSSIPGLWNPTLYTGSQTLIANASSQFNSALNADLKDAYNNAFQVPLEYTDQLPPFDLTLTMVDNTGNAAYMVIGGMEIINEGGGYNIDDMVTQVAYTFVARYMRPLTPVSSNGTPITNSAVPYTSGPIMNS